MYLDVLSLYVVIFAPFGYWCSTYRLAKGQRYICRLPVGLWDRQDLGRAQWWWVPLGHPVVPQGLGDGKDSGIMVPLVGHGSPKDSHGPPGTRGYFGRTWDCDGKPGHE